MIVFLLSFLGFPSLSICLPTPILSSSCGHLAFCSGGCSCYLFPNSVCDPRAQIPKLADLSYMLRKGIALKGEWLSPDELGFFFFFFFNAVWRGRAGTVPDQNEQTS